MGRDKVVVSVGNAEAYTGGPHANLAPYGWANCGFAPASQSIYGGMTLNVGIGVSACLRPSPRERKRASLQSMRILNRAFIFAAA
jgi:hypothetical protein